MSSDCPDLDVNSQQVVIDGEGLQSLLAALKGAGYVVVGPTVRDGAIVYDRLASVQDLPIGWTDEQAGGHYRLRKRDDGAWFGYAVGPHSWKKFLFPSSLKLWSAQLKGKDFRIDAPEPDDTRYAFIGVRSCEMHAIAIQDRVFLRGQHGDPNYQAIREKVFIVAVNCGQAGGTCFCVSMNTGPGATFGYDLALTEVVDRERHYFVAESGTQPGRNMLSLIRQRPAEKSEAQAAREVVDRTARSMGRQMNTTDIKALLYRNYENPAWDKVANRCLTCANCTMVCPTCFCSTVEDTSDVTGQTAQRTRVWDSCFNVDFSYLHGGSVRPSGKSRYRQWMTHKLASWIDQFGTSGCVGCGRCITWCPVGIDITEEVRLIRESESSSQGA
ncbi:MAG TPA: 4Fe-4S dicluster domain-containing protein [Dehalococcoidia bacterium]|nr:4Fe-4S dicluster domain-containing protein [Dehalococcoidia bacterium]